MNTFDIIPLRASMEESDGGAPILVMEMGFDDGGHRRVAVVTRQPLDPETRDRWERMRRFSNARTERIEGKIRRAELVPEAVTHCLETLPAAWGNVRPDPRRRLPFDEKYITSAALRIEVLRAARQALHSAAPPEVDAFSDVTAALEDGIHFLANMVGALEANLSFLDVGLFLEALRFRFDLTPGELAFILVHHPRVLHYIRGSRDEWGRTPKLLTVAAWIRKQIQRATKRTPGRRDRRTPR